MLTLVKSDLLFAIFNRLEMNPFGFDDIIIRSCAHSDSHGHAGPLPLENRAVYPTNAEVNQCQRQSFVPTYLRVYLRSQAEEKDIVVGHCWRKMDEMKKVGFAD